MKYYAISETEINLFHMATMLSCDKEVRVVADGIRKRVVDWPQKRGTVRKGQKNEVRTNPSF